MSLKDLRFTFVLLFGIALAGCSNPPANDTKPEAGPAAASKAKKDAAPAQLESGREAQQKLYAAARNWAIDSQPLKLASNPRKGDAGGSAAVWSATFASAAKKSIRNFMWSGATGEDAPESGISQGSIDTYSPDNASTRPFDMNYLKVDSTEAFEMAQKHGGAKIIKKEPDTIVQCALLWDPRASRLLWSIKYAPNGAESKLNVIVNATTGQFVRIEE